MLDSGRDREKSWLGEAQCADAGAPGSRKPVLVVLHQPQSTPGRIGYELQQLGYPLDVRRPRFGDPLPQTLAGHAGAIIFGGPMSANDPDDYIRQEIDWIGVPLKENKPFLGVCLGAQMLARHLGAAVSAHPEAVEIGYFPLRPAAPEAEDWPRRIYHWHTEGFDLAAGCRLLATGDGPFPNQAFAYGKALGVQFHPEITYAMVHCWTTRGARRLALKGAQPREHQLADHIAHARSVHAWLPGMLTGWLGAKHR